MFDPSLIPEPNEEITQILEGLIVQSTASEETQKVNRNSIMSKCCILILSGSESST